MQLSFFWRTMMNLNFDQCPVTWSAHRTIIYLMFILLNNISSTPSCPPRCSSCKLDTSNQLITATCTDVQLQSLSKTLQELHVQDARPMTLPLGKLMSFYLAGRNKLHILTMQNYKITMIQDNVFTQCPNLKTLDLSKNQISTVSADTFSGLKHLVYLSLNDNQVTAVSPNAFKDLTLLTTLELQSNMITDLQAGVFTGVHKVESINLENNNLTIIQSGTFSNMPYLHSLNLKRNHLKHLATDSIQGVSLFILNLAQNNLTSIPTEVLQQISNTNPEVNLASNQITSLNDGDFKNVTLTKLFLISNELSLVQPDALKDGFIQILDLEQNKLQHLPERMLLYLNKSIELFLSNNLWICDCDIQWLTSILKNDSTVCSEPANFKGWPIRQIKNDLQVACNNPSSIPVPTRQFPVPPQQDLITPVLKNPSDPFNGDDLPGDSDSNNKVIVVSVVVTVILLLLVAMVVAIILMKRTNKVSDLNMTCRKPDANSRPRLPKIA